MKIIVGKIDVTKINKARLFPGKNGAKYLDFVMIEGEQEDRFGNHFMVVEAVSKEERERGVKGPILGNAKHAGGRRTQAPTGNTAPATSGTPVEEDDVPF